MSYLSLRNGFGINIGSAILTADKWLTKYASWRIKPPMASGVTFASLEPRTLLNSVSNGLWLQNVSFDVLVPENMTTVIAASKITEGVHEVGISLSGSATPATNAYVLTDTLTGITRTGNINTGNVYFTMPDVNTGFPADIQVTSAEWRAFFLGWVMCNADGSVPYVSGAKNWKNRTDNTGLTATLPTLPPQFNRAVVHVRYQLATPIDRLNAPLLQNPQPPRTLPNGVLNDPSATRVSPDVILKASDVTTFSTSNVNNNIAFVSNSVLTGMLNVGGTDAVASKMHSSLTTPRNGLALDAVDNVYRHSFSTAEWYIFLPKSVTTLAQAQALIAGTVVRFQLATPITESFINPMIDLSGQLGKNLFDVFNVIVKQNNSSKAYLTTVDSRQCLALSAVTNDLVLMTGFKENTQYTFKAMVRRTLAQAPSSYFKVVYTDNSPVSVLRPQSEVWTSQTFTSAAGKTILELRLQLETSTNPTLYDINTMQLEEGATATAVEPYGKENVLLQGFAGTQASGNIVGIAKGVGDGISYTNLVTNGDFSQGTAGWVGNPNNLTVVSGVGEVTGTGANFAITMNNTTVVLPEIGKRYYLSAKLAVKVGTPSSFRINYGGVLATLADATEPNTLKNRGAIVTATSTTNNTYAYVNFVDSATQNGKVLQCDELGVINLTDNPQVIAKETELGRQLTVAECDYLFAFTSTTATVKVKTIIGTYLDGTDDVGLLNSALAPNPQGTDDFWQLVVFKPDDLTTARYFGLVRNESTTATIQYGMLRSSSNNLDYYVGGENQRILTPCLNELQYVLYGRLNGQRFAIHNGIEKHTSAFSNSLVSQPNTQWCARSGSADGVTKSSVAKGTVYDNCMGVGPYGSIDKAELVKWATKHCRDNFGLGA